LKVRLSVEEFKVQSIPEQKEAGERRSGLSSFLIDILETLVLAVILFVGINAVSVRIRVDGSSMEPTLHSGAYVLVNKLSYRLGQPAYGDIIVFYYPRDPGQEYIKRVIGLPGDQVEVVDGEVYVNDRLLDEPYISAAPIYPGSWTVPDDALFVFGDNRNNSSDSHTWGPLPISYVVGKAVLVYWPPTDWGLVEHAGATAESAAP
jgi:signal peptidase I